MLAKTDSMEMRHNTRWNAVSDGGTGSPSCLDMSFKKSSQTQYGSNHENQRWALLKISISSRNLPGLLAQ